MNDACIELCRERFKYYPNVYYYTNEGLTCDVVSVNDFDLIASYDSMVHMAPEVIESYVHSCVPKLAEGGLLWFDHSGKGEKKVGYRTAMTDRHMQAFALDANLAIVEQVFRNDHDCISILKKLES